METAETGIIATRPITVRVDDDLASRFATCCRALGLTVYERTRPADLSAARSGFTGLVRHAHDQCDAWVGLAAAGDTSTAVCWKRFRATRHRRAAAAPGGTGARAPWDSITTPGCTCGSVRPSRTTTTSPTPRRWPASGRFAEAHELVSDVSQRRPSSREARGSLRPISTAPNGGRTSSNCSRRSSTTRTSTTHYAHAVKIALGVSLARLGMFAAGAGVSRGAGRPDRRCGGGRRTGQGIVTARAMVTRTLPARCCRTSTRPTRRTQRSKKR